MEKKFSNHESYSEVKLEELVDYSPVTFDSYVGKTYTEEELYTLVRSDLEIIVYRRNKTGGMTCGIDREFKVRGRHKTLPFDVSLTDRESVFRAINNIRDLFDIYLSTLVYRN